MAAARTFVVTYVAAAVAAALLALDRSDVGRIEQVGDDVLVRDERLALLRSLTLRDLDDDLDADDRRDAAEVEVAADHGLRAGVDPREASRHRADQRVVGEDEVREHHRVDRVSPRRGVGEDRAPADGAAAEAVDAEREAMLDDVDLRCDDAADHDHPARGAAGGAAAYGRGRASRCRPLGDVEGEDRFVGCGRHRTDALRPALVAQCERAPRA